MSRIWVSAVMVLALGCNKGEQKAAASSAAPAASATPAPSAAARSGTEKVGENGCLTSLDYLVPPQHYGDSDLVRAIAVDGDQVYFRNMHDVFRVPLAGGAPTVHSKAPGLQLSGRTEMWAAGDRLIAQSAGEPIFMGAPKAGGAWSSFIDLTAAKRGGGRDVATRILQGLGSGGRAPRASQASFDGESFYWAETSSGKGKNSEHSTVKSMTMKGGEPRTLYEAAGEIGEVLRAGERVVFMHTAPLSAEQLKQQAADRKANKFAVGLSGEKHLMSVPLAGGEAKQLMRISSMVLGAVLGSDGNNVYASGYENEELTEPGIFRIDATGASPPERLDQRTIHGDVFVVGSDLVFVGSGMIEHGKYDNGQLVLTADRHGSSLKRVACITDGYTLHARAVADHSVLLALFKTKSSEASIAKIPLP